MPQYNPRQPVIELPLCGAGDTVDTTMMSGAVLIMPELAGRDIIAVAARVITPGTSGVLNMTIKRRRAGVTVDVLSTHITIDSGEYGTDTAATPPVIDPANDDLQDGDMIWAEINAVHTTPAVGATIAVTLSH